MAAGDLAYTLVRPEPEPVPAPALDAHQQAVVDHRGGPLLVLAGPGTGKTTTLVEAVVDRVSDGLAPEQVLVLTFSRKAALELRDRVTARLGRTTSTPSAWTFHAFGMALLTGHAADDALGPPPRLLTGPEQDVLVRDLLVGSGEGEGSVAWPPALEACLDTYGFRDEVRALLARAREAGLEPEDLARYAAEVGREDWAAVAGLFGEYLDVADWQHVCDYADLVHRAVALVERPEVQAELRAAYPVVFVDEYQDTDPLQERLLRGLAGDGRELVVVGDPDQSIYGFRGADVRNILEFRDRFPRRDGTPARVLTLGRSRRAGEHLLEASRTLTERMPLPGLPVETARAHRALVAEAPDPGRVGVHTFPSGGAELDWVADRLRRAHLEQGVPWDRMAVLVRSGARTIPVARRVLGAAGVPVEVAGDELPLAREPAVAPLLQALAAADDPAGTTAEDARGLLLSPLGGADAGQLRRLGRVLRAEERAAGRREGGPVHGPRPSDALVREALLEPERLVTLDDEVAAPVRRLGELLRRAGDVVREGGSPEEALWVLWDGTPWPRRLARASYAGGPGGRAADRDLDAVCALFAAAARAEERRGHLGVRTFLAEIAAQEVVADPGRVDDVRGGAVRVLTAHRSKGLEWDFVVVAGVQEGVWPDLRRRGSLLEADRLGPEGPEEPPTPGQVLAEERRLFYVAATRARERLVVTAVDSPEDDGQRPSRFLTELGVEVEAVRHRPRRPLSVAGLVAELRATAVDPAASAALRRAATARLSRLAAETDDTGRPLVPAAHPSRWWGLAALTDPGVPLHDPARPVRLSGSTLEGITTCPLRWFLQHEAHAESARTTALGFGSVVHVLADEVAQGVTAPRLDALTERLDRVWDRLAFEAPWQSAQQRDEARDALERFLRWHVAERGRVAVASEHRFEVSLAVGETEVRLRGSMDRVEVDADGRVHVVDFKTGKAVPATSALAQHPQLGAYQLAAREGALADLDVPADEGGAPRVGGAELVQLRKDDAGLPKVQRQGPLTAGEEGATWVEDLVAGAVTRVLEEDLPPVVSETCDRCEFRRCCSARPEGRQVVE